MRRILLVFLVLILALTVAALGGAVVAAAPSGNTHVIKTEPKTEYVWSTDSEGLWHRYECSIRWHAVYTLLDPQTNLWHLTRQSHEGVLLKVVDNLGNPIPNPSAAALAMIGSTYTGFYTGTLTGTWDETSRGLTGQGNWDLHGMWKAWRADGLEFSNSRVLVYPNPNNPAKPYYDTIFTNEVFHIEKDSFDGH